MNKIVKKGTAFEALGIGASGDETLRIDAVAEEVILDFCKKLPGMSFEPRTIKLRGQLRLQSP